MANTTLIELVKDLKFFARVQTSEGFSDPADFQRILSSVVGRHNKQYGVSDSACSVPLAEHHAVVLLAWAFLCRMRASRFAVEANTSQGGFGTDRNTPYYKCIDLAKTIEAQYKEECIALGLTTYYGSFNNAVVSSVTCENLDLGVQTPIEDSVVPPTVTLSAGADVVSPDGTLVLRWEQQEFSNFDSFTVFTLSGSDPIYQDWNYAGSVFPRINDLSSKTVAIRDQTVKAIKLTGLPVGSSVTNRFLVVCKSKSGKSTYSNEVVTVQPAGD